jgi:hypothetical protein
MSESDETFKDVRAFCGVRLNAQELLGKGSILPWNVVGYLERRRRWTIAG